MSVETNSPPGFSESNVNEEDEPTATSPLIDNRASDCSNKINRNSLHGRLEQPEKSPECPEKCPELPEKCPDLPEKCPDLPEKCPELLEKDPDLPEKYPDLPEKYPELPEKSPELPEKSPELPERSAQRSEKSTGYHGMNGVEHHEMKSLDHDVIIEDLEKNLLPDVAIECPEDEDPDDFDDEVVVLPSTKFNPIGTVVTFCQQVVIKAVNQLSRRHVLPVILLSAYTAYFIAALLYRFGDEDSYRLIICTILGIIILIRSYLYEGGMWLYNKVIGQKKLDHKTDRWLRYVCRWVSYFGLLGLAIWTIYDNKDNSGTAQSVIGLACFLGVCVLFSNNPREIDWHPVIWGLGLQFIFAIFTMKYSFGRDATLYIQDRFDEFFGNTKRPMEFLFGNYKEHQMLLETFPLMFLMSATMALLLYLGAVQLVISVVGKVLYLIMGTESVESICVAASIFLDGTTAMLAVLPYLEKQSKSQLFTIITSVFASLGGTYLAIMSKLMVPLNYILPAMVISAPATFSVCKILMPETRPKNHSRNKLKINLKDESFGTTATEAFTSGALLALTLFGNIIAILFAFVSGLEWLNHTLEWFGERVGQKEFSMEFVLSYIFYPVAWAMGIQRDECRLVGKLLGIRFINSNMFSFIQMGPLISNRYQYQAYMLSTNFTGQVEYDGDNIILMDNNVTLGGGMISERSQILTTFSLCGFSSVISLVLSIAVIITLIPKRRVWIMKIGLLALFAGNMTNFMTACFAGLFY